MSDRRTELRQSFDPDLIDRMQEIGLGFPLVPVEQGLPQGYKDRRHKSKHECRLFAKIRILIHCKKVA